MFKQPAGLVPALDVDSVDAMLRVVEKTAVVPGVVGYKLGLTGTLPHGLPAAIRALREITDLPVIYDHQKAGPDMPDMAQKFARLCKESGADALILFPVAGPSAVKSFVSEAIGQNLLPVVGGHIPVPDYCVSGGGFMVDDVLARILSIAAAAGARHFVLPANDPAAIGRHADWLRDAVTSPAVFLTGFGTLGGSIKPAFGAAAACRNKYAIVGRAVTASKAPADTARKMIDEIMATI